MRVAFVAAPANGHINPMIPIAAELVRRGDQVTFVASEAFAPAVLGTGAAWISIGNMRVPDRTNATAQDDAMRRGVLACLAEIRASIDREVRALGRTQFHVLVYDFTLPLFGVTSFLALAAARVALYHTFAVPADSVWPAASTGADAKPAPEANALTLPGGVVLQTIPGAFRPEALNLVTVSPAFQPDSARLGKRFAFVGPCLREESPGDFVLAGDPGQPLLLASLGTVATNNSALFRAVRDAAVARDMRVVLATGRTNLDELGPLPASVVARPFVPQLTVLREAAIFVTHGGMNSVMEALRLGVPLIVVPQVGDQFVTARRVEALGLGRSLEGKTPTAQLFGATIDEVLGDPAVRARIAEHQQMLDTAGGVERAATLVRAAGHASQGL